MTSKKIAFVTDSTAYMTEELRNHPDVYVVPIVVISDGREFEDLVDLSSDQLYEIIRNNKEVPKTSQPSVGSFQELYEKLKEDYDQAVAIHISNKLSGTLASSSQAKDQAEFDVEVVDSLSVSYAMTTLLTKGIELANHGLDAKSIADQLNKEAKKSRNLILLGSLEQLYKGGRMSGASFLLGNFLQIKPILKIDSDGELGLFERIRSEKKAVTRIIELLNESAQKNGIEQIQIMHGNALDKARDLKARINEALTEVDIVIGEISSSLAVHAGEGTLAVLWNISKKD